MRDRKYIDDEELLDYVRWHQETYRNKSATLMERGGHVIVNDVRLWFFHLWFWHDIPIYTGHGLRAGKSTWRTWEGDNLGHMTTERLMKKHDEVFGPHEHGQQLLLLDTTEVDA